MFLFSKTNQEESQLYCQYTLALLEKVIPLQSTKSDNSGNLLQMQVCALQKDKQLAKINVIKIFIYFFYCGFSFLSNNPVFLLYPYGQCLQPLLQQ